MQSSGAQPLHIHSHDVGPLDGGRIKETDVPEIEQERVKYLTLIHSQLHNQFYNQFNGQ
jgi:hypothetical protein